MRKALVCQQRRELQISHWRTNIFAMKARVAEARFLQRAAVFTAVSFKRAFSKRVAVVVYVLLICAAAFLVTGIVSDFFTRTYRLIFAGSIFALCLVSSIVYGIPAAVLTLVVNLLGASFSLKFFHTTADWYYLAVSVFQLSAAVSSVIIAVLADMQKTKTETHEQASLTDALTEVYNTRFFYLRLDEEITRSTRKADPLTLLLVDVNAFKSINDNFGHLEGDRVLRDVASYLRQSTRISDVVCRCGGDEFGVILPDTNRKTGLQIAKRVAGGISQYIMTSPRNGLTIPVYLSVGIATFPADADERTALIEHADKNLYKEKHKFYTSRGAGK